MITKSTDKKDFAFCGQYNVALFINVPMYLASITITQRFTPSYLEVVVACKSYLWGKKFLLKALAPTFYNKVAKEKLIVYRVFKVVNTHI